MMTQRLTAPAAPGGRRVSRAWSACAVAAVALLLAACVTETTGGFAAKRSEAEVLQDYLQLATGYLEQGDLASSKRHLGNAERLGRESSELWAIWGLVHAREGELRLARSDFERSLQIDPANARARNNFAAFLFAVEETEAAFAQLELVVADTRYAARSQAFENLGLAALRLGRWEEARLAFERAVQLNPEQLRSQLELAGLHLEQGRQGSAEAAFGEYLRLMPKFSASHDARSLWLGIRLEAARGNRVSVLGYGQQLEAGFASAPEVSRYHALLDELE